MNIEPCDSFAADTGFYLAAAYSKTTMKKKVHIAPPEAAKALLQLLFSLAGLVHKKAKDRKIVDQKEFFDDEELQSARTGLCEFSLPY